MKAMNVIAVSLLAAALAWSCGKKDNAEQVIDNSGRTEEQEPEQRSNDDCGQEYKMGGTPVKAQPDILYIPEYYGACESYIIVFLNDKEGRPIEGPLAAEDTWNSDPSVIKPYYNDFYKYYAIHPPLPDREELWTNIPIFTTAKVQFLPGGPVEDLEVEYRFYDMLLIPMGIGSPSDPNDPEILESFDKMMKRRIYTVVMQRVRLNGEQVWQRETLYYPPGNEGYDLYSKDRKAQTPQAPFIIARFTKVVD